MSVKLSFFIKFYPIKFYKNKSKGLKLYKILIILRVAQGTGAVSPRWLFN